MPVDPNETAKNPDEKSETLRLLRARLKKLYSEQREFRTLKCEALSRILPEGVPRGGIVEWLGEAGCGVTTLSLRMAEQLCQDDGVLAVVDGHRQLYPPAMAASGIDMNRTLLLHPESQQDKIWALIQCLRCPSVTVVWSRLEQLNAREFRCLQLAAEKSGVVGIFARSTRTRSQPTWANVRLLAMPQCPVQGTEDTENNKNTKTNKGRRFTIEVINCMQGTRGNFVTVERDALTGKLKECHEPLPVCLAPKLASSSIGRPAARTW